MQLIEVIASRSIISSPGPHTYTTIARCIALLCRIKKYLPYQTRQTFYHSFILPPIGLYRDVWIAAIASSTTSLATRTAAICVRFQGRRVRRVYVTMQITFLTRKSALIYRRGLRQRVASLTLNCNGDFAIRAYGLLQYTMGRRECSRAYPQATETCC